MKPLLAISALTSAIICGSAIAQDEAHRSNRPGVLELTMTLIPNDARTSAAVTAIIELPPTFRGDKVQNTQGAERSARGLDTASLSSEHGRELGEAEAAAARDNLETVGRASHDGRDQPPPAAPPEPTERTDLPSR
jgi:hypothetical protein